MLRVASYEAMPTNKMRLLPLLTVCDQVLLETFVAVTQFAVSLFGADCTVTLVTTFAFEDEPSLLEESGS